MTQETINLINSLPEDLRSVFITQDANGNYSIDGSKFQEALDKAHPREDDIIIEIFFRTICENQWQNIPWEKVEPLMPTLKHICKEVGFKDVNNPFLKFLEIYLPTGPLSNENLIDINNLYANDVLSYSDIHGDKDNGNRFSIIYRPELYQSNDVQYMIKADKFLNSASNLNKMNWESIYDGNVTNNISKLALDIVNGKNKLNSNAEVQDARATIMYKDKNSPELNSDTIVKEVLTLGSKGKQNPNRQVETPNNPNTQNISSNIINQLKNSNLTVDEIKALLSNIQNSFGL